MTSYFTSCNSCLNVCVRDKMSKCVLYALISFAGRTLRSCLCLSLYEINIFGWGLFYFFFPCQFLSAFSAA